MGNVITPQETNSWMDHKDQPNRNKIYVKLTQRDSLHQRYQRSRYLVALSVRNKIRLLKRIEVQNKVSRWLDQQSLTDGVRINAVHIRPDSLYFELQLEASQHYDVLQLVQSWASGLIQMLDEHYPELRIKSQMGNMALSRWWKRPYLIISLPSETPDQQEALLNRYLNN